jgi:S1-C subfamily serine protease
MKRFAVMCVALAMLLSSAAAVSAAAEGPDQSALAQQETGAWLGVQVADTSAGVMIRAVVSDSPADQAGLRRGEVIESVDGTAVESADQLVDLIQAHAPGDVVTLAVSARGESRDVEVTLGERPEDVTFFSGPTIEVRPYAGMMAFMGLEIELTEDGLLITSIAPESPLADSGLQDGDLIVAINGEPVADAFPSFMMSAMRADEPLVFTVSRDGEEMDIEVTLDFPMMGAVEAVPFEATVQIGTPTQLGVQFRALTAEIAADEELPVEQGALVVQVFENTPAAEAGLQEGDIITAVDGDAVDEERTLSDRLYAYEEGDVVTLTVRRGNEDLSLEVTLGPRGPEMFIQPGAVPMPVQPGYGPNMPFGGPQQYGPHHGWFFFGGPDMMPFGNGQPRFFFGPDHQECPFGGYGGHGFFGGGRRGDFGSDSGPDSDSSDESSAPSVGSST